MRKPSNIIWRRCKSSPTPYSVINNPRICSALNHGEAKKSEDLLRQAVASGHRG